MIKENLKELIDLDELAEEKFSLEVSINQAKEILKLLREEDPIFNAEFEDDVWVFEKHLAKGNLVVFDFSGIGNISRFSDYSDYSLVVLIKCWIATLLGEYYPAGVRTKFGMLIKLIKQTDFFNPAKATQFAEYLRNYSPAVKNCLEKKEDKNLAELLEELKKDRSGVNTVKEMIIVTLNFLTFSELSSFDSYYPTLSNIKKGLPRSVFVRQLPSGKDILKLHYCIEKYFENGFDSLSRTFFAPILIWWKLTNVIPIRISEFCTIKRNCISENNGSYYITLPREKKRASKRRVQAVDTLEITEDIYNLIAEYIQVTNKYGESKTLISIRTLLKLEVKPNGRKMQRNLNYSNKSNFESLLKRFYRDIVYGEYKKTVKREVKPNDTRHLAFCSLLMQGISPIEIARLGGHSTIDAQYHYSNHTEYFIDIEVYKLIQGFIRKEGEIVGNFEAHEISYDDIEGRSYTFPEKHTELFQMEIGWCTDQLQRCESEECMLCKHWWIHPIELVESKQLVEAKLRERKQKIVEMGAFLKNLNENFTATMVSDVDPNLFNIMETKAASIQEHLEEIARLEMLKGVGFDE